MNQKNMTDLRDLWCERKTGNGERKMVFWEDAIRMTNRKRVRTRSLDSMDPFNLSFLVLACSRWELVYGGSEG